MTDVQRPDPSGDTSFADALRHALDASGLGLERVAHHLKERGVTLSVATLSYWQSGRSVPGRLASFAALAQLEDLLEVDPGALARLVPRRSTNPRSVDPVVPLAEASGLGVELPPEVAGLDARIRRQLEMVSEHDTITIGSDRAQQHRWARHVVTAKTSGADRLILFNHADDDAAAAPTVTPLAHCYLGDRYLLPEARVVVQELMFDRALDEGESIIVEYRLEYGPPFPRDTNHELRRRMPLRELVLELRFDPADPPTTCEWYERPLGVAPGPDGDDTLARPLELDPTGAVAVIRHDVTPGTYGLRWAWA